MRILSSRCAGFIDKKRIDVVADMILSPLGFVLTFILRYAGNCAVFRVLRISLPFMVPTLRARLYTPVCFRVVMPAGMPVSSAMDGNLAVLQVFG